MVLGMADRFQLQETYSGFSDEQLLSLSADSGSLTDEARGVLSQELQRRHLGEDDLAPYREEQVQILRQRNQPPSPFGTVFSRLFFGALGSYLYKAFRDIATGKQSVDDSGSNKPRK